MKLLCVSNTYVGLSITIGKWYDGFIDTSGGCFIVKDDKEIWSVLNQTYFKTIEDIREEKLNELGI